jgi:hypothetical protein
MIITGTVSEWEGWTDMRFPESGAYVVEGALQPVEMDLERDLGCRTSGCGTPSGRRADAQGREGNLAGR